MESSIIGPTTRIIWHDPNVDNDENVSYFAKSFSQTEIERFTKFEDVVVFLDKAQGFWIVITSGRNGSSLLKFIHDSQKVIGIVIFCRDKVFHEQWARDYPKVKKVVTVISEVVSEVELLYKRLVVQGVLQVGQEESKNHDIAPINHVLEKNSRRADDPVNEPQDIVFYHTNKECQLKFAFVARLLLEDYYHDYPEYIINELKRLNPISGEQIEQLFKEKRSDGDLFKAILYLYSTDYIYRPFNQRFASQAYDELAFTLSACVHEIMKRPELRVDPTKILYRGLGNQIHGANYIVNGETIYWPAFTSTSLEITEAEGFAGNEGIVFKIALSQTNPHPNVILKEDWSAKPGEKEVLLFPHFAMKVKSKESYGSRMLICVEHDDKDGFLSLKREELSKYWGEFVGKLVKPNYEAAFELIGSKFLQDFQSRNAVSEILEKWGRNNFHNHEMYINRLKQLKLNVQENRIQTLSRLLDAELNETAKECRKLLIYSLFKEISGRVWSLSQNESLEQELRSLLEKFLDILLMLNQENSNQKSEREVLITKAIGEMSMDWAKFDEKMKLLITQKLEKIKPELLKKTEEYWQEEQKLNH